MKFVSSRRCFIVALAVLLVNLMQIRQANAQAWLVQPSGTMQALRSISYCDSMNGFAVGNFRTILHTTDGGATWNSQDSPLDSLMICWKVTCVRPGIAMILAVHSWTWDAAIVATTDSGTTWIVRNNSVFGYGGISFVDEDLGFVLGWNGIFETTDAGATWQSSPLPDDNARTVAPDNE